MCIYKNTNALEALSDSHKYFTFVRHIYSFKSMIPKAFLFLTVTFVFAKAYEVFTTVHKYFTFGSHMCLYTPMTTFMYSFLNRHISISLFISITFETIHKCVSIHNTYAFIFIWKPYLFFHIYDHLCILCVKGTLPRITFFMYACAHKFPIVCAALEPQQLKLLLWKARPDNTTYQQYCIILFIQLKKQIMELKLKNKVLPPYVDPLASRWHTSSESMKPSEANIERKMLGS